MDAFKGLCVLCKDVLSYVFQTFDFQVLGLGVCALCLVLLNAAMETYKGSDKNGDVRILVRLSYFYLLPFLSACSHWDNIQLMHSFEVNLRICQPEKVMSTEAKPRWTSLSRVD